jgi:hypothetical protein
MAVEFNREQATRFLLNKQGSMGERSDFERFGRVPQRIEYEIEQQFGPKKETKSDDN